MTAHGLLGELKAWSGLSTPSPVSTTPMPASAAPVVRTPAEIEAERSRIGSILDVCDRVVGETGRRLHVFDWLQPTAGGGDRLAVDAYYPAHELVVVCQEQPEPHHGLWAEWIPAHGLRLFTIKLADYRGDPGPAFSRLMGELRLVCDPQPRVSAPFQPLRSAMHRFTAAPQPFVVPLEPSPEPPPLAPAPANPTPFVLASPPLPAALQRYLTTPGSAPSPPPRAAPPPPPPSPPPRAPAPPPVPVALQRYVPTTQGAPATLAPLPPALGQFVAAPMPFDRVAPTLEPVLESLAIEQERELKRRRVGQRQAEAAARAARFVKARAAGSGDRDPGHASAASTWRTWSARPASGAAIAPAGVAFAGMGPTLEHHPGPVSPTRARAEAVQRALSHVRSTPGPFRHPAHAHATMDGDDMALGVMVAVILMVEVLVGFALALGGGPAVLGLGLVLDATARALGTMAAARAGEASDSGWSWSCGLIGSPAVAAFAFKRGGPVQQSDLVFLVGPIAVVAVVVLVTGLAGLPAGI